MLSHGTLNAIIQAYNPTLGALALGMIGAALAARQWRVGGVRALHLVIGLLIAYGLMFIDNRLRIWPYFDLDYSTHTAVTVILVTYLGIHARKAMPLWIVSTFAYFLLMVYQKFHTIADIVTTAIVVMLPLILILRYLNSYERLAVPTFGLTSPAID